MEKTKEKINEKKRKNRKVEKKINFVKKEGKSTVDYCCNPQCFWVWGNSDFPTPFSYMYNVAVFFLNYKKRISNRNLIKEKRIIKMLFTSMLMFAVPEQSFK